MTTTPDRTRVRSALFGLAVGDALGWPQEQNADNLDRRPSKAELSFRAWRRRGGHWRQSYEEEIGAGHYSDDTQLTLCVARSRLRGADWVEHLTRVELPAWTTYQRGGGGAVLRAAKHWAKGQAPWTGSAETTTGYFNAGANGVAMRVLPHVVVGLRTDDFDAIRHDVIRDGVTTHGHPRALVGALAYASALRTCLSLDHTLGHGELLDTTIANVEVWGSFDRSAFPDDWAEAHDRSIGNVETSWNNTRDELLQLLRLARDGVEKGSLVDEVEVLRSLGVFDRSTNGAGTVSAAAALFATSRFADSPERALLLIAYLERADTDTLASMTGALLGAIDTDDRMAGLGSAVQDYEYLGSIADELCEVAYEEATPSIPLPVVVATAKTIDHWTKSLAELAAGNETELPDGRSARLVERTDLDSRSIDRNVRRYTLCTADGQSVFVTKLSKRAETSAPDRTATTMVGVRVLVPELAPIRDFYESALGLVPSATRDHFVKYGESLAVEVTSDALVEPGSVPGFIVHIEAHDVESVYQSVTRHGSAITVELATDKEGRQRFTCTDPAGNRVEVVAPRPRRRPV